MTNSKNELNKFKKINNFKELMKKLYDLFNYLVKKYKFYGEKITKIIDNMYKYKDEYKIIRISLACRTCIMKTIMMDN